jgi:hypothetical protein
LKNQKQVNRPRAKLYFSRRIEFGVIWEINNEGYGIIRCEHGDFVEFYYGEVCRAIPGTKEEGRPILESVENPTLPRKGMMVAFIAGQRFAGGPVQAYRWCPFIGYEMAKTIMEAEGITVVDWMKWEYKEDEIEAINVTVFITEKFIPSTIRVTHGHKPVTRGPSGRPLPANPIEELGQLMDRKTA